MSRNCYCHVKGQAKEEGLLDGYCAFCDICGRPGHIQAFPGASPQSGAWCNFHYWVCALLSPNGRYGFFLWLGSTIAASSIITLIQRDGLLNLLLRLIILLVIIFILQNILYFMLMRPKKRISCLLAVVFCIILQSAAFAAKVEISCARPIVKPDPASGYSFDPNASLQSEVEVVCRVKGVSPGDRLFVRQLWTSEGKVEYKTHLEVCGLKQEHCDKEYYPLPETTVCANASGEAEFSARHGVIGVVTGTRVLNYHIGIYRGWKGQEPNFLSVSEGKVTTYKQTYKHGQ